MAIPYPFTMPIMDYGADDDLRRGLDVPLYEQLAGILRARIRRGDWMPRYRVDSEADLMKRYGVARNTVRQALKLLQDERLVRVKPHFGYFVVDSDTIQDTENDPDDPSAPPAHDQ